jgi:hypothetical protein
MFRATSAHHQEDQILSIHHLVLYLLVGDCLMCRSGWSSLPTGTSDIHSPECVIPDDVLIQVGPPDDEHLLLENVEA